MSLWTGQIDIIKMNTQTIKRIVAINALFIKAQKRTATAVTAQAPPAKKAATETNPDKKPSEEKAAA